MAWLSMDEFYLFWLIPSIVSFILSSLMALNIFLVPELRTRIYQRFLAVLALTDIVKTSSWFIAFKYTAPYSVCTVQEYWFQFGAMSQALAAVLICAVAYYTVSCRQIPSMSRLFVYIAVLFSCSILSLAINIGFKTGRLFCSHSYSGFYEKHFRTELYVYSLSSLFPIMVTVFVNLASYFAISNKFRKMNVVLNLSTSHAPLHVLVYRLRAYPVIFSMCYIPLLAIYITTTSTGDFSLALGGLAAICVSSLGSAMSLNYFYYQKTLSPFVENIIYFWKPLLSTAAAEAALHGTLPLDYFSDNQYGSDQDGTTVTEPMLGSSYEEDNDQVTITRYFPSIDMSESNSTIRTVSTAKHLLTVD
jgi:hypothetical protein